MGDAVPISGAYVNASYVTVEDAENYFEFRLHASAWEDAENDDKCRALVTATRLIDRLNFAGLRTADYNRLQPINWLIPQPRTLDPSSLPGQNFEFPRNGSVTIPQDIVDAACEIALALLDGVDPELEMQGLGTVSQRFAAAGTTFDTSQARMAFRHGIPSFKAWNLLTPYLADPTEVVMRRVN
jgi:hypothetical protein